jgi:hypothetical protein
MERDGCPLECAELREDFRAHGNGDRAKALNKSTGVENNPVGRLIGR